MPRNLIHHTLWRRPNAQHGHAAGLDLRAAGILDRLGRDPQSARPALQLQQLLLRLHLYGDLGLPEPLPAREDAALRRGWRGLSQGLVAGEGGVGGLGGDFA